MDEYKKIFIKQLAMELLVAGAIIVPIVLGIWFLRLHVEKSVSQITETRQNIAVATKNMEKLLLLRTQYDEFGEEGWEVLQTYIPERDFMFDFQERIIGLASSRNLGLGMSSTNEVNPSGENLGYLEFRLNITGLNLDAIIGFMEDLKNKDKLVTIVGGIEIESTGGGYRAITNIRGYFR